jgi:hypothetical protein
MRTLYYLPFLLTGISCSKSEDSSPAPLVVDEQPTAHYLVGIRADEFECDSIFTMEQAASIFGGRVERLESTLTPPAGVPKACNYQSHAAGRPVAGWSFDLDCRPGALRDASQLMVNYADAPDAHPLLIGQSALDHNDSALLFIDDDTPCYGRVIGPGKEIRSQVATALAAALKPRTAPTGAHLP